jgi:hypothetical protein
VSELNTHPIPLVRPQERIDGKGACGRDGARAKLARGGVELSQQLGEFGLDVVRPDLDRLDPDSTSIGFATGCRRGALPKTTNAATPMTTHILKVRYPRPP